MVIIFRNMIKSYKSCSSTQADASIAVQKRLSEVYPDATFDVNNVTEHNFIQSTKLGNCGMIASMASLANNHKLINEVVPPDQNFRYNSLSDNKEIAEFQFNLYKNGILHRVVVNESLAFWNDPVYSNELYYSDGRNQNFVGPLLEKALIKLFFNGNYELARNVDPVKIITSFFNAIFEEFYNTDLNDLGYKVEDVITHGKKTNSLMVVEFKNTIPNYSISNTHAYTLIDYTEDMVKLYDPHGIYI